MGGNSRLLHGLEDSVLNREPTGGDTMRHHEARLLPQETQNHPLLAKTKK